MAAHRRANRARPDSGRRSRAVEVAMRPGEEYDFLDRDEPSQTFCCLISAFLLLLPALILAFGWQVSRSFATQAEQTAVPPNQTAAPTPSGQHFLPIVANPVPPPASTGELAFLKDGDIYLKVVSPEPAPCGTWMECTLPDPELKRLTKKWGAIRFAWSPDGRQLAAYDGRAVRIQPLESQWGNPLKINLGMPERQVATIPSLMWTPDLNHVLLWNIDNPRDDIPVGWFLIDLEDPDKPSFYPGRVGNVLALADGSLILTQVVVENQSLKTVGLWRYNPHSSDMEAFNLDGINRQGGLGMLNTEVMQQLLTGTAHVECGYYSSAPDSLNLGLSSRLRSTVGKEMPYDFLLAPEGGRILATRGAACGGSIPAGWADTCWPGGGPGDYTMHLWNGQAGTEEALVAGMFADWSPDGQRIAFQSCLAVTPFGLRVSVEAEPPWIYMMNGEGKNESILPISEGCFPAWRPVR